MGGIKPPPDYHRRLNRDFMRKVIAANALFVLTVLYLVWSYKKGSLL